MESVDIIIIGAGVIGLSVASEVSNGKRNVFIVEKGSSFGQETSSRNSEVIHAGIYYPPGTLKAKACYEGRNILYEICPKNNIAIKKTGKLLVAVEQYEINELKKIQDVAAKNGVKLDMLSAAEVKKLEPNIYSCGALFSPETGVVDSHQLMKYYLTKAQNKKAENVYLAEVVAIEKKTSEYKVTINNQGEIIAVLSRVVINCAGNNADKIVDMCGINIDAAGYRQYYLKGNYFRLSDKWRGKTTRLIYPVPKKNSLGIHTVLDLSGGVRLGPDEEEIQEFDYKVNSLRQKTFFEEANKYLPQLKMEDLTPDMAGIRPQLRNPNKNNYRDFIINEEAGKGFPGLINLVGIESPGLTASPYIGKMVAQLVDKII